MDLSLSWLGRADLMGQGRLQAFSNSLKLSLTLENAHPVPAEPGKLPFFREADCVELFLKDLHQPDYHELHCSCNGLRYQIHVPDHASLQAHRAEPALPPSWQVDPPGFGIINNSVDLERWQLELEIPFHLFPEGKPEHLQFLCAGYDHALPGDPPRLWSSAPLSRRDFHLIEEWHLLRLQP